MLYGRVDKHVVGVCASVVYDDARTLLVGQPLVFLQALCNLFVGVLLFVGGQSQVFHLGTGGSAFHYQFQFLFIAGQQGQLKGMCSVLVC